MISYRVPSYRPAVNPYQARLAAQRLGAIGDMSVGDWALLVGGGIVGGAGINGIVGQIRTRKWDAIGLLMSGVLTAVGLTVFVDKFRKLIV